MGNFLNKRKHFVLEAAKPLRFPTPLKNFSRIFMNEFFKSVRLPLSFAPAGI